MAVYIWQENAFDKMAEVEGEDWKRQQEEGLFGNNSFAVFKRQYEELVREAPNIKDLSEFAITITEENDNGRATDSVIYGHGGWNRYVVLNTGEICFIELMAPSVEYVERAKKAGFRIW